MEHNPHYLASSAEILAAMKKADAERARADAEREAEADRPPVFWATVSDRHGASLLHDTGTGVLFHNKHGVVFIPDVTFDAERNRLVPIDRDGRIAALESEIVGLHEARVADREPLIVELRSARAEAHTTQAQLADVEAANQRQAETIVGLRDEVARLKAELARGGLHEAQADEVGRLSVPEDKTGRMSFWQKVGIGRDA